jgi:FtsH-binding integral membrane protein
MGCLKSNERLRNPVKKLIFYLIAVIAVWLLVSPLLIGYADIVSISIAVIAALGGGITAVFGAQKDSTSLSKFILGLGVLMAAWGLSTNIKVMKGGPR